MSKNVAANRVSGAENTIPLNRSVMSAHTRGDDLRERMVTERKNTVMMTIGLTLIALLFVAMVTSEFVVPSEGVDTVFDDIEQQMAGGFIVLRHRKGKKASKGAATSTDEDDSTAAEPAAPSGGAESGSTFRRPKRSSFSLRGGTGGTAQPLHVSLISQLPTTGLLGNDFLYPAGYIGEFDGNVGVIASMPGDVALSFISCGLDGTAVVNPRAYQVRVDTPATTTADLARISAYSVGSLWGRMAAFLKRRTAHWTEMNQDLEFEGYLLHHFSTSLQAGAWLARSLIGLWVEDQYLAGRKGGKAGVTSEHTDVPYAKLFQELKPYYQPSHANLDATKADYTIAEWFAGFAKRLNPLAIDAGVKGHSRPRFVLNAGMFDIGFRSVLSGYSVDGDGNNLLLLPIMETTATQSATLDYIVLGDGDLQPSVEFTPGSDNSVITEQLTNVAEAGSVGVHWTSAATQKQMDAAYARYNGIRYNTTPVAPDAGFTDVEEPGLNLTDNGYVLPPLGQLYTLDTIVGPLWGKSDFVGLHNVGQKVTSATPWTATQSLLNADPDEFVRELEAWNDHYPQEVQEYIEHLGATADITRYIGDVVHDYQTVVDEINLHGKYKLAFNPRKVGEWQRGPGFSAQISDRWYEAEDATPQVAGELFALKYPDLQLFLADGHLPIGSEDGLGTLLQYVDPTIITALMPSDRSQGQKGERGIVIPAGRTVEGVNYNGTTPVGGAQWISRLIHATNTLGLHFGERYPCTDLDFTKPHFVSPTSGMILLQQSSANVAGLASPASAGLPVPRVVPQSWFVGDATDAQQNTAELGLALLSLDSVILDDTMSNPMADLVGDYKANHRKHVAAKGGKWKDYSDDYWAPPVPVCGTGALKVVGAYYGLHLDPKRAAFSHDTNSGFEFGFLGNGTMCITEEGYLRVWGEASGLRIQNMGPTGLFQPGAGPAYYTLEPAPGDQLPEQTYRAWSVQESGVLAYAEDDAMDDPNQYIGMYGLHTAASNPAVGMTQNAQGANLAWLVSLWTNMWLDVARDSVPVFTAGTPTYILVEKGTAPACGNKVEMHYVKLTKEGGGPVVATGPGSSLDHFAGASRAGGFDLQPGSWEENLFDACLDNYAPRLVGTSGKEDTTKRTTVDVYLQILSNNGTLITPQGVPMGSVAEEILTCSGMIEIVDSNAMTGQMAIADIPDFVTFLETDFNTHAQGDGVSTGASRMSHGGRLWVLPHSRQSIAVQAMPERIIPNAVSAYFHPEFEIGDAAVLYWSTDPRQRFAWSEGPLATPFHGELAPFRYAMLEEHHPELASMEQNPLTMSGKLDQLRFGVTLLDGLFEGRQLEENGIAELLVAAGIPNLTREVIYDVEEASRS